MKRPRPKLKITPMLLPNLDTKFHIDFDWWEESNLDLNTFLFSRLNIGEDAIQDSQLENVDLIDAKSGEVRRVDGFQYALQGYFRQLPEDFASQSSLVDSVFCVLLANANAPMSAAELADRTGREPDIVLRTLAGKNIYLGIRTIFEEPMEED